MNSLGHMWSKKRQGFPDLSFFSIIYLFINIFILSRRDFATFCRIGILYNFPEVEVVRQKNTGYNALFFFVKEGEWERGCPKAITNLEKNSIKQRPLWVLKWKLVMKIKQCSNHYP